VDPNAILNAMGAPNLQGTKKKCPGSAVGSQVPVGNEWQIPEAFCHFPLLGEKTAQDAKMSNPCYSGR
jgi:hypothetical protein